MNLALKHQIQSAQQQLFSNFKKQSENNVKIAILNIQRYIFEISEHNELFDNFYTNGFFISFKTNDKNEFWDFKFCDSVKKNCENQSNQIIDEFTDLFEYLIFDIYQITSKDNSLCLIVNVKKDHNY